MTHEQSERQLDHITPGLGVYAGSFDPPTNGHAWVIEHAATLFGRLVVAVADNPEKSYSYPLERRLSWLREISDGFANVEVTHIENQFLAHFARDRGAGYIVRGIRNEADYQYERAMRYVNEDLNPGLTTTFVIPPRDLCEISSSFVKNMMGPAGWEPIVRDYLPACVARDLVPGG
ncbi:MAG: pantetheine-phosphate adenylyltransferase [Planctomycetota bacterium]